MNKKKKALKKIKKSQRANNKKPLFEVATPEFANTSPLRGVAYVNKGDRYGW